MNVGWQHTWKIYNKASYPTPPSLFIINNNIRSGVERIVDICLCRFRFGCSLGLNVGFICSLWLFIKYFTRKLTVITLDMMFHFIDTRILFVCLVA